MPALTGIDAPTEVPEGSTGPVEISSSQTDEVIVHNSRTGSEIRVRLDGNGNGRFELPDDAECGDDLILTDPCDPTISTVVSITPASSP